MQLIALPLAAIVLLGVPDESAPPSPANPRAAIREFTPFAPPGRQCRDGALPTNEQPTRQPRFEREPATTFDGQIIYAVDRRIDGCSIIVAKYGISDIRNLLQRSDAIAPASPPMQGK